MMEFVNVIHNDDKKKQAVFMLPPTAGLDEQYFLYSYVNNDVADETMVFRCDKDGNSDMEDLLMRRGYVHSSIMMETLTEVLTDG